MVTEVTQILIIIAFPKRHIASIILLRDHIRLLAYIFCYAWSCFSKILFFIVTTWITSARTYVSGWPLICGLPGSLEYGAVKVMMVGIAERNWLRTFFVVFYLGREEFSGLDNDALDFSQLEDFIANETDTNGRWEQNLTGSDIS